MYVSGAAPEIRQLQAKVYGRDGAATQADIDRLEALTTTPTPGREESPHTEVALRTVEEAGPVAIQRSGAPRSRSSYSLRGVIAGAFALIFGIGMVCGWAFAASMPAEPVRAPLPPDADRYVPGSIVYYGETDGVEVWTATLSDGGRQCMIAMRDGGGGGTCAQGAVKLLTVDLSIVESAEPGPTVTMDLSTPDGRPTFDWPDP